MLHADEPATDGPAANGAANRKAGNRSCLGCRLSKVKCDHVEGEDICKRCARLGLECTFVASQRGKSNPKRDVARLGPAVRALLRTAQPDATANQSALSRCVRTTIESSHSLDHCSIYWHGNECQKHAVEAIATHEGRVALLKHWFMIGVRSGSCGLLGNVLILAHQHSIALNQLTANCLTLQTSVPFAPLVPQAPLSEFLRSWYDASDRLCCLRSQIDGVIDWRANGAFRQGIGEPETLQGQLELEVPTLRSSVDYLICTAEIFFATPLHPEDRMCVAQINADIWSQARSCAEMPDCEAYGGGVQLLESTQSHTVRCLVKTALGPRVFVTCTLQARAEFHPDAKRVYSVFSLSIPSSPLAFLPNLPATPMELVPSSSCAPAAPAPLAVAATAGGCSVQAPIDIPLPTSQPPAPSDGADAFASIAPMLAMSDRPIEFQINIAELGLELGDVEAFMRESQPTGL